MSALKEVMNTERSWGKDLTGSIGLRGVRENDRFIIDVFQERKKTFKMNRTKYIFKTGQSFEVDYIKSTIALPVYGNDHGSAKHREAFFEMELIPEEKSKSHNDKSRYILRSLGATPFRLNGIYCFEAFLERGDLVDIGFNRIHFCRHDHEEEKTLIELPSENIMKSSISILIEGETGTGKTTLAKEIHEQSGRPGRFVHLNLSAFSAGLIESELFGHVKGAFTGAINGKRGAIVEAHRGTLFLDEIDSLTMDLQTKLLLFLDDHCVRAVGGETTSKVDVRLIFSSGSSLKRKVLEEKMRKDFYYRLMAGHSLLLEPLRENPKKVREFCLAFEEQEAVVIGDELIEFYHTCPWPGNIRQLKGHLLKKKIVAGGKRFFMDDDDRSLLMDDSLAVSKENAEVLTMEKMKMNYCYEVYVRLDKNITRTAKILELSPNTLKGYLVKKQKEFSGELSDDDVVDENLLN